MKGRGAACQWQLSFDIASLQLCFMFVQAVLFGMAFLCGGLPDTDHDQWNRFSRSAGGVGASFNFKPVSQSFFPLLKPNV
jgi:hypothetical protein